MRKITLFTLILFVFSCEDKVEKDKLPPELTIVYPKGGETLSDTVMIQVETKDNEGISHVEFYIDDSLNFADSSHPYQYDWPTIDHEDGEYLIKTISIDLSDNRIEKTIKVSVNNSLIFIKIFNIDESNEGRSIQQTLDGGYIITGYITQNGYTDVCLIKTDSRGIEEWKTIIGGRGYDKGFSVQQTIEGGYVVIGVKGENGIDRDDVWLIKFDSKGVEEWNKIFGGIYWDYGLSIQQTIDGGFIITGIADGDPGGGGNVLLIKTDSDGIEVWNKTFSNGFGESVKQTLDGGYIICGRFSFSGDADSDLLLINTDSDGNKQWSKVFGENPFDEGLSVQQTSDGGYIVVGYTYSYGSGKSDIWLIKTDENGNEEWSQTFGGSKREKGNSIQQTNDGGFVIVGYTYSFGNGQSDIWLLKTDLQGNKEWDSTFGGTKEDYGYSVRQTTDGGYILTGSTKSFGIGDKNIFLIKTDSEGNTVPYK